MRILRMATRTVAHKVGGSEVTVVRGRWFPAAVTLPGRNPWSRCYVIAADNGLHIFKRRAEQADWHSGVEWATTVLPTTDRAAKAGFTVNTDAGQVVVTVSSSGCRCGSLGTWSGPSWARAEAVRT